MKLISWNINGFRSLMNRTLLEMNESVHACSLGILSCCFYNLWVDIITLNVHLHARIY